MPQSNNSDDRQKQIAMESPRIMNKNLNHLHTMGGFMNKINHFGGKYDSQIEEDDDFLDPYNLNEEEDEDD
jgi:hypothetical protein